MKQHLLLPNLIPPILKSYSPASIIESTFHSRNLSLNKVIKTMAKSEMAEATINMMIMYVQEPRVMSDPANRIVIERAKRNLVEQIRSDDQKIQERDARIKDLEEENAKLRIDVSIRDARIAELEAKKQDETE